VLQKEESRMGMMKEFEDFAMRGNVVDMAVGIIIGTTRFSLARGLEAWPRSTQTAGATIWK
jgi:hypothetical protein